MRRRFLLAILGTVVLALVLSSTGTYLLLRRQAHHATESNLRAEAESLVGLVANAADSPTGAAVLQKKLVTGLRLEGVGVVVVGPAGFVRGDLPSGVTTSDVTRELIQSRTFSGQRNGLTWAAASTPGVRGSTVAIVITRKTEAPRLPIGWFLLGGGLALAVGAAVAAWLSDTLTRPLRRAQAATVRIAAGDLSTRVPEPAANDHDEVAELTRSINAMAAGLAHSRGLERQFLLSVSHDLRTPLTSIRGYADAITDGTATDTVAAARVISAESQRLSRLVGDLLDLARLDAHEFTLELRPVAVSEVVTDTTEGFRPTAEEAGIALTVIEPPTAVASSIDPDRLAQAIANLVENGLKYATSTLLVETRVGPQGEVHVQVADDGPGIAPDDVARVFERLFVTDRRPRRQVGGSGLGLAIVRELVTGMGGTVWAESPASPDGRGARFVLAFPPLAAAAPATPPA